MIVVDFLDKIQLSILSSQSSSSLFSSSSSDRRLSTSDFFNVFFASPLKRGARFHYNFLLKIILLYMQAGLAHLDGISLDPNGVPGQPGLNLSI